MAISNKQNDDISMHSTKKKNTENITCHIASSMTNAYFCKKNTCKVLIGTIVLIVLNCKYANVFQADF